jgi:hypothetical protein
MSRFGLVAAAIASLVSFGVYSPLAYGEMIENTVAISESWSDDWVFENCADMELPGGSRNYSPYEAEDEPLDRNNLANDLIKCNEESIGPMDVNFVMDSKRPADPLVAQSQPTQTLHKDPDAVDVDSQMELSNAKKGSDPNMVEVDDSDLTIAATYATDDSL